MNASWHAYSITSSTRIELSNHKEKIVTPEEWPIKRDHISIYILITNLDGNSMSGKIVRAPKQATSVWKKRDETASMMFGVAGDHAQFHKG